jgi:signal transduction histidine kinase
MRPEPVDIGSLVAGVTDVFGRAASEVSVSLVLDAQDTGDRLMDPDRVTQILSNLIENALRYTPEMGVITVGVTAPSDEVTFVVHNTGPGIAEQDLPRVFDRLYVAERYRAIRPSGSGLGLAIVAELVEAMGGAVTCISDDPEGTTFTITIPAERL